jgi:two-component system, cell cycle response regulator
MTEHYEGTDRRGDNRVTSGSSRILVVDDSRAIRQILRRSLEDIGYSVAEAADGVEALAACRLDLPDLVLLDVDMPVMDGLATLQEMRADCELSSLPVIFLTARTTGDDVAVGLGLGAQDYLRKPCHPAELEARVSAVLRLKAAEEALQQHAKELDELSTTDALTGLGNRRRFELESQDLVLSVGSSGLVGLIMIDIDHFKTVNDTEGHPIGDLVLRIVAGRLQGLVMQPATIVRWGGEEFLVLVPGASVEALHELGERLRTAVCDSPLGIGDDRTLTITISAGCSVGPIDALEHAIRLADEALYEAKRTGRNRVATKRMNT